MSEQSDELPRTVHGALAFHRDRGAPVRSAGPRASTGNDGTRAPPAEPPDLKPLEQAPAVFTALGLDGPPVVSRWSARLPVTAERAWSVWRHASLLAPPHGLRALIRTTGSPLEDPTPEVFDALAALRRRPGRLPEDAKLMPAGLRVRRQADRGKLPDQSLQGSAGLVELAPLRHQWEWPLWLGFGGFNGCPEPETLAALARAGSDDFGAELWEVGDSTMRYVLRRPAKTLAEAEKVLAWFEEHGSDTPRHSSAEPFIGAFELSFWWD